MLVEFSVMACFQVRHVNQERLQKKQKEPILKASFISCAIRVQL